MESAKAQMDKAKEKMETLGASARDSIEDWRDSAGDAAHRASQYVHDRLEAADDRIVDMTGRPLASWTADMKRYIRQHPLQSALIAVGIGWVLGKVFARG